MSYPVTCRVSFVKINDSKKATHILKGLLRSLLRRAISQGPGFRSSEDATHWLEFPLSRYLSRRSGAKKPKLVEEISNRSHETRH